MTHAATHLGLPRGWIFDRQGDRLRSGGGKRGPSGHHDGDIHRAVRPTFGDSSDVAMTFSSGEMRLRTSLLQDKHKNLQRLSDKTKSIMMSSVFSSKIFMALQPSRSTRWYFIAKPLGYFSLHK
ncbi:glutamate receptor 2 [Striga asiatica]|uniref:Glutamate receptor 2 n=1 Tax=Striga asiatica TaxID=4170 RepID=A0A5A7P0J6_STRAF|nr:glutamate receptor 2 [Striga asiatica]